MAAKCEHLINFIASCPLQKTHRYLVKEDSTVGIIFFDLSRVVNTSQPDLLSQKLQKFSKQYRSTTGDCTLIIPFYLVHLWHSSRPRAPICRKRRLYLGQLRFFSVCSEMLQIFNRSDMESLIFCHHVSGQQHQSLTS